MSAPTKTPFRYTSGVPAVRQGKNPTVQKSKWRRTLIMFACCVPMVIAGALIFASIPSELGWGAQFYAVAPLIGCVAIHLVMFLFMGKSCHTNSEGKDER